MRLIAALIAMLFASSAYAADVGSPTLPFNKTLAAADCTISSCSGPYIGADLIGNGTNADIVGNGINQSVFSAGGIIAMHAGWQLWNGNYFAAVEGGIGYSFPPATAGGTVVNNNFKDHIYGEELVKLGMGLNVFNQTSTTAPGQTAGPINVPASLSSKLISPYLVFGGIQHNGVTKWVNGAGAEFALASGYTMDISYMYAPPQGGQAADNLVKLGLHYFFKP